MSHVWWSSKNVQAQKHTIQLAFFCTNLSFEFLDPSRHRKSQITLQNQNTACQAIRFTNFPPWWSSACLWRRSCYTVSRALHANRSDVELYVFFGLVDAQWGNAWMNWTSFTNGAIEANYRVRYVYITDYNRTISLGLFCLSKSSMSCAPPSLVPVRTA